MYIDLDMIDFWNITKKYTCLNINKNLNIKTNKGESCKNIANIVNISTFGV